MARLRWVSGLAALAIVAASCAGTQGAEAPATEVSGPLNDPIATSEPSSTTTTAPPSTTTSSTTTTTTRAPISDPHVEVNGARLIYRCEGDGPHTVIFEQGLVDMNSPVPTYDNFMGWAPVAAELTDEAVLCAYNRRGVGGSDLARTSAVGRTTQDQVNDLVELLQALDLDTPIIMVGWSQAGMNIRLLAEEHPDLISGAVFVDASHPEQDQALGMSPPSPSAPEYLDIFTSSLQTIGTGDMGDKPLVVLTGLADKQQKDVWLSLQEDHASLSTNSRHVIFEDAGHGVHGRHPEAVVDAIRWVISEVAG